MVTHRKVNRGGAVVGYIEYYRLIVIVDLIGVGVADLVCIKVGDTGNINSVRVFRVFSDITERYSLIVYKLSGNNDLITHKLRIEGRDINAQHLAYYLTVLANVAYGFTFGVSIPYADGLTPYSVLKEHTHNSRAGGGVVSLSVSVKNGNDITALVLQGDVVILEHGGNLG